MAWKQELAVIMDGGKTRLLTPADIRKQTGLVKQNVSRGLAELDDAGLAERRSDDDKPLRNGHILIYSWASPRPRRIEAKVIARDYLFRPGSPIPGSPFEYLHNPPEVGGVYVSSRTESSRARLTSSPWPKPRAITKRIRRRTRALRLEPVRAQPKRTAAASLYPKKGKILQRKNPPTDRTGFIGGSCPPCGSCRT